MGNDLSDVRTAHDGRADPVNAYMVSTSDTACVLSVDQYGEGGKLAHLSSGRAGRRDGRRSGGHINEASMSRFPPSLSIQSEIPEG